MGSLFSGFLKAASLKSGNGFNVCFVVQFNGKVVLRANWKDHREAIRKEGLQVHPLSKECQNIWNAILKESNLQYTNSAISIPVETCEDSIFDQASPDYRQFDSVHILR